MSKKKSDDPEVENEDKKGAGDTARRIWLAGLGAYGKAFSEASESFKDVTGKTSEVFDDLAQKGEIIEMAVSSKRKALMKKAGVPSFDLDERIAKMRSRLSGSEDVSSIDVESLEARMDAMDAKLDKILKLLSKPVKTATTKRTTKK